MPVLFFLLLQLIYFASMTGIDIYRDRHNDDKLKLDDPQPLSIAIEGFVEVQAQFYLFFVTPLRLADKYRITQEVTPAGTIYAINITIATLVSCYVRFIIFNSLKLRDAPAFVQRMLPLGLVALAMAICFKPAVHEYRQL